MKVIKIILSITLLFIAGISAVINLQKVELNLFIRRIQLPLAWLILLFFVLGFILAVLWLSGMIWKRKRKIKKLNNELLACRQQLEEQAMLQTTMRPNSTIIPDHDLDTDDETDFYEQLRENEEELRNLRDSLAAKYVSESEEEK